MSPHPNRERPDGTVLLPDEPQSPAHAAAAALVEGLDAGLGAFVEALPPELRPESWVLSVTSADGYGHTAWGGTSADEATDHAHAAETAVAASRCIVEVAGLPPWRPVLKGPNRCACCGETHDWAVEFGVCPDCGHPGAPHDLCAT